MKRSTRTGFFHAPLYETTSGRWAKRRKESSSTNGGVKTLLRLLILFLSLFLAGQTYVVYRSHHVLVDADRSDNHRMRRNSMIAARGSSAGPDMLSRDSISARRRATSSTAVGAPTPDPFPPLSSLVDLKGDDNSYVKPGADLQFLLDFAIVGFAKSGTTAISRYLRALGVSILPEECCYNVVNKTAKLTRFVYQALPHDMSPTRMPRGLKCPQDLSSDLSLPNYERFFGRTKLIVGIRSPISFFNSFYNFRAVNTPWKDLLPTSELANRCIPGSLGICGWRASFVDFLYKLGKTPGSFDERKLLELHLDRVRKVGDVFIYELGQLSDTNETRARQFRNDLGKFLGLQGEMPPIPHVNTLGRFDYISEWREEGHQRKINICDEEHEFVRSILQDKTERTSKWMREYFLESKEVVVSSPDYMTEILDGWMKDPCSGQPVEKQL
mmetsp:Transcript_32973/g.72318  ORF Transcript_32973/g.72318 Transcript_32973/m.72318 type:complete len:442 (+) Transcript_32973:129-1454(+)